MSSETNTNRGEFEISITDLDLLRNSTSHVQKPPSVLRRAIVAALRKGRKKGGDDEDTLGASNLGFKDVFEKNASDHDQE